MTVKQMVGAAALVAEMRRDTRPPVRGGDEAAAPARPVAIRRPVTTRRSAPGEVLTELRPAAAG